MTGSPTAASPGQKPLSSPVNPADAFEQLLWANPEVCSNCFTRCRDIRDHGRPVGARGDVTYPSHTSTRTPDGIQGRDVTTHDDHGAIKTHQARTTCANCGSVGLLATDDSLSREEAVGRIDTIADRLEEDGWQVDRDRARSYVSVNKRAEALTNLDWEIFAAAVQLFAHPPDPDPDPDADPDADPDRDRDEAERDA